MVDSNLKDYAGKIVELAAIYSRESALRAWRVVGLKYYPKAARLLQQLEAMQRIESEISHHLTDDLLGL